MDYQQLSVKNDVITLEGKINIDTELQGIKDERDINRRGFTAERSMKKLGSIPAVAFRNDPLLQEALLAQQAGDKQTFSRCVRLWLKMNPEWGI